MCKKEGADVRRCPRQATVTNMGSETTAAHLGASLPTTELSRPLPLGRAINVLGRALGIIH